ncbi:hypothetical protein OBBRIDRAFT_832561 [Obba rivulosa]|uniref:Uncharacterized protein n=1 Tax=Obba rivulosa TaxID=1052685 RepID=A0A8E2J2S3_9APHY|nr:hypothetical protein OBBRIDRAFT_832561 [Obba rivulosa]
MSPSHASTVRSPITPSGDHALSLPAPPKEVVCTQKLLAQMKESLGVLSKSIDSIGEQAIQTVKQKGDPAVARIIESMRKEMDAQDQQQQKQVEEIKSLLQEVLEHDVMQHLRTLIEQGVLEQIDQLVAEQVAEHLKEHIPQELQDEVVRSRKELAEAQQRLHNSESRRANARLSTSWPDDILHTMYKNDGTVSEHFPKSLSTLFSLDADTAQKLLQEYEIPGVSASRERSLNSFMQFCGVPYQLVRTSEQAS